MIFFDRLDLKKLSYLIAIRHKENWTNSKEQGQYKTQLRLLKEKAPQRWRATLDLIVEKWTDYRKSKSYDEPADLAKEFSEWFVKNYKLNL